MEADPHSFAVVHVGLATRRGKLGIGARDAPTPVERRNSLLLLRDRRVQMFEQKPPAINRLTRRACHAIARQLMLPAMEANRNGIPDMRIIEEGIRQGRRQRLKRKTIDQPRYGKKLKR